MPGFDDLINADFTDYLKRRPPQKQGESWMTIGMGGDPLGLANMTQGTSLADRLGIMPGGDAIESMMDRRKAQQTEELKAIEAMAQARFEQRRKAEYERQIEEIERRAKAELVEQAADQNDRAMDKLAEFLQGGTWEQITRTTRSAEAAQEDLNRLRQQIIDAMKLSAAAAVTAPKPPAGVKPKAKPKPAEPARGRKIHPGLI